MPGRYDLPERDQGKTGFTKILENLIDALPGVAGGALVDELGECVDYGGVLEAYELRLASAHMQIELRHANERMQDRVGTVQGITVCAHKRTYVVTTLAEGYVLVLVFTGGASLLVSSRALSQAEYDIRKEAGWDPPVDMERWIHVRVEARPHDRWRPSRVQVGGDWRTVEVIGTVMGLKHGEKGFRVRTATGEELTLVREGAGNWFADDRY